MLVCDLYSMALSLANSAGERLGTCDATLKTSTAERMTVRVTDSEGLKLVKKVGVKRSGMSLMDLKKRVSWVVERFLHKPHWVLRIPHFLS